MNFAAAVLIFREGLEGALIIALMLGYLRKVGRLDRQFSVWAGALSAAGLAVMFTVFLQIVGAQFTYPAKGIYEGATSLVAVAMLSYMIFWMSRQARYIKGSLEQSMHARIATGAAWGLFALAFATVAREGVETALFLSASAFESSGLATLWGGLAGLAVALAVAWAVYIAGVRLNIRTFFRVTSILLVIFAAAILRYGIHEFNEIGWLPALVDPIWNTAAWIPESGTLGSMLQALVGYASKPTLIEAIGYVAYLAFASLVLLRVPRTTQVRPAPVPAPTELPESTAPVESARA